MKHIKRIGIDWGSIVVLILIDQFTKLQAIEHLKGKGVASFIPGLQLRYIENTGGAFSFFEDGVHIFSIVTSILLVAGIVYYAYRIIQKKPLLGWYRIIYILVLAGGVGNLIDRVFRHYVVDFFEFTFINFPIFNVADIYVTIVMALLVIYIVYEEFFQRNSKQ